MLLLLSLGGTLGINLCLIFKGRRKKATENPKKTVLHLFVFRMKFIGYVLFARMHTHTNIRMVYTYKHVATFTLIKMTRQTLEILIQIC